MRRRILVALAATLILTASTAALAALAWRELNAPLTLAAEGD